MMIDAHNRQLHVYSGKRDSRDPVPEYLRAPELAEWCVKNDKDSLDAAGQIATYAAEKVRVDEDPFNDLGLDGWSVIQVDEKQMGKVLLPDEMILVDREEIKTVSRLVHKPIPEKCYKSVLEWGEVSYNNHKKIAASVGIDLENYSSHDESIEF